MIYDLIAVATQPILFRSFFSWTDPQPPTCPTAPSTR